MVEKKKYVYWSKDEETVLEDFWEKDSDKILQNRLLCLKNPTFRSLEAIQFKRHEMGLVGRRTGIDVFELIKSRQEKLRSVV